MEVCGAYTGSGPPPPGRPPQKAGRGVFRSLAGGGGGVWGLYSVRQGLGTEHSGPSRRVRKGRGVMTVNCHHRIPPPPGPLRLLLGLCGGPRVHRGQTTWDAKVSDLGPFGALGRRVWPEMP